MMAFRELCRGGRRWVLAAGACLVAGVLVSGCAIVPSGPPEEVVKERASKRWKALIAGDFSAAYDDALPANRKAKSREEFVFKHRGGGVVTWLSANVVAVKCEQSRCKTTTELTSKPLIPGFRGTLKQGIEETWVFEDGRWWFAEPL
ncbi:MAG: hypothetical protein EBS99_09490 [Betaproteobacteria bacterium]|nr:hypothetical protein [Betaproteobacteria bacterium]